MNNLIKKIVDIATLKKEGHIPSSLSILDIITILIIYVVLLILIIQPIEL